MVALLLPMLPNVEKWAIGDTYRAPYVEKAIKRAKDGMFGAVSVTHVELLTINVSSDGSWADCCFSAFKILGNLPHLQSIKGKGIGGIGIEDGGAYDQIPTRASAVSEIYLKDCELSGGCLSKIINFSIGLESFTYRSGGRAGDGSAALICSPELAKALTPHNLTMKSLDLDTDGLHYRSLEQELATWKADLKEEADDASEDEDEDEDEDGDDPEIGNDNVNEDGFKSGSESLNSASSKGRKSKAAFNLDEATKSDPYFPNLTYLRVGIQLASKVATLSGKKSLAEWLPASLEELEIVGYGPDIPRNITEQVDEVVGQRATLLPKLRTFTGVDEHIENGKELADEEDYVASE